MSSAANKSCSAPTTIPVTAIHFHFLLVHLRPITPKTMVMIGQKEASNGILLTMLNVAISMEMRAEKSSFPMPDSEPVSTFDVIFAPQSLQKTLSEVS